MLHYYFEGILNMEARSVSHGTLVIERSFAKTPERVFAAFSDSAKMGCVGRGGLNG